LILLNVLQSKLSSAWLISGIFNYRKLLIDMPFFYAVFKVLSLCTMLLFVDGVYAEMCLDILVHVRSIFLHAVQLLFPHQSHYYICHSLTVFT